MQNLKKKLANLLMGKNKKPRRKKEEEEKIKPLIMSTMLAHCTHSTRTNIKLFPHRQLGLAFEGIVYEDNLYLKLSPQL